MDFWFVFGWFSIFVGLFVGPPQLYKAFKTKNVSGVSKVTYFVLVFYMGMLLARAIHIGDFVFTVTNSLGIIVNGTILLLLYYYGRRMNDEEE